MNVLKIISSFHKSLGLNLVVDICQPYFRTSQLNQMNFFFSSQLEAGYDLQGLATSRSWNSKTCFLVALKRALKRTEQGPSVFTVRWLRWLVRSQQWSGEENLFLLGGLSFKHLVRFLMIFSFSHLIMFFMSKHLSLY